MRELWIALGICIAFCALTWALLWNQYATFAIDIDRISNHVQTLVEQEKLVTSRWTDTNCVEQTLTTEQLPGETESDFIARHKRLYDLALKTFPIKTP